jgi:hypothetical protein
MMPEQLLTELRKLKGSGVGDAELWTVAFQAGEAKALQESFLDAAKPVTSIFCDNVVTCEQRGSWNQGEDF